MCSNQKKRESNKQKRKEALRFQQIHSLTTTKMIGHTCFKMTERRNTKSIITRKASTLQMKIDIYKLF